MKRTLFATASLSVFILVGFQTAVAQVVSDFTKSEIYVNTRVYTNETGTQYRDHVQYYDAFGLPTQAIQVGASTSGHDLISLQEYDELGRKTYSWLPAVKSGNQGAYVAEFSVMQLSQSSNGNDQNPYSLTVYALNRVEAEYGPGQDWHKTYGSDSKAIRTEYMSNTASGVLSCAEYTYSATGTNMVIAKDGNFAAGELYVTKTTDEDSSVSYAFKNKQDQVVLVRQVAEIAELNTYYIYDNFGKLKAVLPPAASDALTATNTVWDETTAAIKDYAYLYKYDGRQRLIEKKVPGRGWEWIVYNKGDQPVLVQDAVQRGRTPQEWGYTKYDSFGRVTETGIHKHSYANRDSAQVALDATWSASGIYWEQRTDSVYTNLTFPTVGLQPLVINYYDDYAFADSYWLPPKDITKSSKTRALATGMKVYKDGGTDPLLSVNYYNERGNLIQTASQHHLGGTDYVTNTYGYTGELLTSRRVHQAYSDSIVITRKNAYDHVGRLITVKHQINGQDTVTLVKNEYNEIGQLINKSIGGDNVSTNFHTSTAYTHNIRGWTKSAISPYFSFTLNYNSPTQGAEPRYNGNISEQHWTHYGQSARYFTYTYDKLNRLTDGNSTNGSMREELTYDNMGNITNLKRDNHVSGTTYSYIGNRLKSLAGAIVSTNDYTYDANGNATRDRAGMNFRYQHLNLPDSAWNGTVHVGYLYDALGNKLRKSSDQGGIRDYVGGLEYSGNVLEIIHTGEGVAYHNNGGVYTYRYNLTDHLGNVRATIYRNPVSNGVEILQQDDYYPFGKQHQRFVSGAENKYLYNGKEKQDELGLYDYGARLYDAEIGRWNAVDPLAEQYGNVSAYNYVLNNPISFIDPDGRSVLTGDAAKEAFKALKMMMNGEEDEDEEDPKKKRLPPVNKTELRIGEDISAAERARRKRLYLDREQRKSVNYQDVSQPTTSLAIVKGVVEGFAGEYTAVKTLPLLKKLFAAKEGSHTIYRVVNSREAADVLENGFRQAPISSKISSYEGKLFWSNMDNAKWYQNWVGKENPILKIKVNNSFIYENGADAGRQFYFVAPERLGDFNNAIKSIK